MTPMTLTHSQAAAMWDFLLAFEAHAVKCYPVVRDGVRAIMRAQREILREHDIVGLMAIDPARVDDLDAAGAKDIGAAAPVAALVAWALEGAAMLRGNPGVRFEHDQCETLLRDWMADQ